MTSLETCTTNDHGGMEQHRLNETSDSMDSASPVPAVQALDLDERINWKSMNWVKQEKIMLRFLNPVVEAEYLRYRYAFSSEKIFYLYIAIGVLFYVSLTASLLHRETQLALWYSISRTLVVVGLTLAYYAMARSYVRPPRWLYATEVDDDNIFVLDNEQNERDLIRDDLRRRRGVAGPSARDSSGVAGGEESNVAFMEAHQSLRLGSMIQKCEQSEQVRKSASSARRSHHGHHYPHSHDEEGAKKERPFPYAAGTSSTPNRETAAATAVAVSRSGRPKGSSMSSDTESHVEKRKRKRKKKKHHRSSKDEGKKNKRRGHSNQMGEEEDPTEEAQDQQQQAASTEGTASSSSPTIKGGTGTAAIIPKKQQRQQSSADSAIVPISSTYTTHDDEDDDDEDESFTENGPPTIAEEQAKSFGLEYLTAAILLVICVMTGWVSYMLSDACMHNPTISGVPEGKEHDRERLTACVNRIQSFTLAPFMFPLMLGKPRFGFVVPCFLSEYAVVLIARYIYTVDTTTIFALKMGLLANILVGFVACTYLIERYVHRVQYVLAVTANVEKQKLRAEVGNTNNLLNHLLPRPVLRRLGNNRIRSTDIADQCSVCYLELFDVEYFCTQHLLPRVVQALIAARFALDEVVRDTLGIFKVSSTGDVYMVCSNLISACPEHLLCVLGFALKAKIRIDRESGRAVQCAVGRQEVREDQQHRTHNAAAAGEGVDEAESPTTHRPTTKPTLPGAIMATSAAATRTTASELPQSPRRMLLPEIRSAVHTGRASGMLVGIHFMRYDILGEAVEIAEKLVKRADGGCILVSSNWYAEYVRYVVQVWDGRGNTSACSPEQIQSCVLVEDDGYTSVPPIVSVTAAEAAISLCKELHAHLSWQLSLRDATAATDHCLSNSNSMLLSPLMSTAELLDSSAFDESQLLGGYTNNKECYSESLQDPSLATYLRRHSLHKRALTIIASMLNFQVLGALHARLSRLNTTADGTMKESCFQQLSFTSATSLTTVNPPSYSQSGGNKSGSSSSSSATHTTYQSLHGAEGSATSVFSKQPTPRQGTATTSVGTVPHEVRVPYYKVVLDSSALRTWKSATVSDPDNSTTTEQTQQMANASSENAFGGPPLFRLMPYPNVSGTNDTECDGGAYVGSDSSSREASSLFEEGERKQRSSHIRLRRQIRAAALPPAKISDSTIGETTFSTRKGPVHLHSNASSNTTSLQASKLLLPVSSAQDKLRAMMATSDSNFAFGEYIRDNAMQHTGNTNIVASLETSTETIGLSGSGSAFFMPTLAESNNMIKEGNAGNAKSSHPRNVQPHLFTQLDSVFALRVYGCLNTMTSFFYFFFFW